MRVLGVIGTMVWDTIWRESEVGSPTKEWGGISYALAAVDAVGPTGLRVRPIIKIGRDLSETGLRFLRELSVIEGTDHVQVVDEPNPRVELRYRNGVRRCERITGGVSPWRWGEMEPRVTGCDALYVNFITGAEMDLSVARALRSAFEGPIYADLHSLLLARGPRGERSPRPLERWSEWLRCFDLVQLNESELQTLSANWGDPWGFAAEVVGSETGALFVTLGPRGAAYVLAPDALPPRSGRGGRIGGLEPVRTGKIDAQAVAEGDPTGCGDVWGITCYAALLDGADVEEAMSRANRAAARNVNHRGARGLNRYLRGEVEER